MPLSVSSPRRSVFKIACSSAGGSSLLSITQQEQGL
jgi:hypothetical protein